MSALDDTRRILESTRPSDGLPPRAWRHDEALRFSLDGQWRFLLSEGVAQAPTDCDAADYDDSSWETIDLPSHWVLTAEGRRGRPIYTNVQQAIPLDPPFTPDDNPIGDHRRTFILPDGWEAHEDIRLCFDGVESIGIVAVNGEHAGVLRGSRLPSELPVAHLLRPGVNVVHVRVAQWSAQTYVEDQDQWWLPGIFREVSLIARPAGVIQDHWIRAEYDHTTCEGEVVVELGEALFPVRIEVPELNVDVTWHSRADIAPVPCGVVEPWSDDHPRLHLAVLSNDVDRIEERIGFRSVEIRGNQWLVNGRKLRLRGVNRHEYHPELGRVFDEDACREGLLLMKRHNINAIRTSHYPPHPRLFDLADELGFWVMDECDLETHAFETIEWEGNPSDDPRWRDALLQRMDRMIRRDRNHPSIICWSLGNESGTGANLAAMAELAHRTDPTRPVHYESDYEAAYSDLVSRMYSPLPEVEALSAGTTPGLSPRPQQSSRFLDKPKILCEFVHAMGNGPGALGEYVELFERLDDWHGGFIWEWRDHGIATTTPDGTPYFAYGGDFGEDPHDGNFVMDGLVHSDGTPSPAMAEVRQQFSPVAITIGDEVRFENRFHAIDTAHLEASWRWEVDGELRAEGTFDGFVLEAGASAAFPLPTLADDACSQRDSFLTVSVTEREDRPWAAAGHVIVVAQHRLDDTPAPRAPRPTAAPLVGADVQVGPARLDARTGRLLAIGDVEVREAGVELWRAPTDNDSLTTGGSYELGSYCDDFGYGLRGPSSAERWRGQGLHRLMRRTTHLGTDRGEFVVVERLIPANGRHGAEVTYRWGVTGEGAYCNLLVAPIRPRTDVTWPRIGFHALLPSGFDKARWFGEGPGESYPDSRAASIVGEYAAPIDALAFPYAMPQETGHREGCRRLIIDGTPGALRFDTFGPDLPGFALLRHDAHELTEARHQHELHASRGAHLYLDAFQHGLGSRSCGPDVLPKYQLWPRRAEFGFVVAPLD